MRYFLNAYSEVLTDGTMVERTKELGFTGIRRDILWTLDDNQLDEAVKQSAKHPTLDWLYLVGGLSGRPDSPTVAQFAENADKVARAVERNGLPSNILFDLGVEAAIHGDYKDNQQLYADSINQAAMAIWRRVPGRTVIADTTERASAERLEWVRGLVPRLHDGVEISIHTYRDDRPADEPDDGFSSVGEMLDAIQEVVGGRGWWNTETGWHTGERKWGLCAISWLSWLAKLLGIQCTGRYTEEEVAGFLIQEMENHETRGVQGFCVYQAFSGPGDKNEDLYGLLDPLLQPKPRALLIADYLKGKKPPAQPARRVIVKDRWLREAETPARNLLPLGNSLFYALGMGMPREHYQTVLDSLSGLVNEARFSMSTLGWGKPEDQAAPAVIPFKPDSILDGYGNEVDPAFLDEMDWRIDYAVRRGIRPQITLLWGGFHALFVEKENPPTYRDQKLRAYLKAVCQRLKNHPGVNLELMNEISHGDHLGFAGHEGRVEFIERYGGYVKELLPDHMLSVSNGGEEYFPFNNIRLLDFWNTHFPRDTETVEGFPRWARGVWDLNEVYPEFRREHPGKGYGRNDEPIFLQTKEDHEEWPYPQSTQDWRMFGVSIFVGLCAGVPTTIHNQSGFFLGYSKTQGVRPEFALVEPIYKVAQFYQQLLSDFPIANIQPFNAGWEGSPVRGYDGPFKAFSLAGRDRDAIIVTVLNPKGTLTLDLGADYDAKVYEVTGELVKRETVPSGVNDFKLPAMPKYKKAAVLRLDKDNG